MHGETVTLDTVLFSYLRTYFQNNEPLHCPKEPPYRPGFVVKRGHRP
jgi:hypothetical protein